MELRNESFTLNDNIEIPKIGLGVFKSEEGKQSYNAVRWALDFGYRHIDTAAIYKNEESVGKAIKDSGIAREDVFVTTKLWNTMQRTDDALKTFEESRRRLDMDYVDLYLLHWPNYRFEYNIQAYEVMLKLQSDGKIRSVGVSNFNIEHLEKLIDKLDVIPSVNQVERHPEYNQRKLKKYCDKHNIRIEAWAPLMQGRFVGIKEFDEIAQQHGKTAAQVLVRWHIQGGFVAIPKSVKKQRIDSNTDVFDFELSETEMNLIDSFKQGKRVVNPKDARFGFESY
ncbi:MAG: aldo/keto reductase [Clostridiales bacterium]|nr:aldo/keto reductase [Clostridiales bacterium]